MWTAAKSTVIAVIDRIMYMLAGVGLFYGLQVTGVFHLLIPGVCGS